MSKPIVGIACHGFSSEAQISMQSAQTVFETIAHHYAKVYYLKITEKRWTVIDRHGKEQVIPIGTFDFIDNGRKNRFSVVFNALHGSPGEDGKLAATLELAGIPHTSCNSYTAGLTFNKRDCIAIARRMGIPTAVSMILDQGETLDIVQLEKKLGYPCFVKANRAGSSFGVYKVHNRKELETSLPKAFSEDTQLIIEKALEGREVSVGVVRINEKITVLPITEIISQNDFFDYAAKYEGQSQEITPADLPPTWKEKVHTIAIELYDKMGLEGITRSEFIFHNGTPHLLEINTVPGMTPASIIPQQCQKANISLLDLFKGLITTALKSNTSTK